MILYRNFRGRLSAMDDLQEKVIKGLECCSQSDNYSRKPCKKCPYNHEWRDDQGIVHLCKITQLRKDALFLLKAQEREISRLKNHVDCEAAETTPEGCVGYGRGFNDDEPCETCKQCPAYIGYDEE